MKSKTLYNQTLVIRSQDVKTKLVALVQSLKKSSMIENSGLRIFTLNVAKYYLQPKRN